MNREELLDALQTTRSDMEDVLEGLTDEQLVAPGAVGDWSVRDVLSHLTAWEAEAVRVLARARQGQAPKPAGTSAAEIEALNTQWHKEFHDRPLDRVLDDFHAVRDQMVRQVEAFDARQMAERRAWLNGQALQDFVESYTTKHEAEHAAEIRLWRREKLGLS